MRLFAILAYLLFMAGCATGISTYDYYHMADGSTKVHVKSANEIGTMTMGINRDTGTLEVIIGDMSKKSDTVEVLSIARDMVHDVTSISGGQ